MRRVGWLAVGLVGFAACSDSATGPDEAQGPAALTVDASTGWAYVALGNSPQQVTVASAATSTAWDLAFFATAVSVNGGAAGPGEASAYCVCQNAASTPSQVMALTPESELADFEAVTLADVPAAATAWKTDALASAITGWYSYDMTTHQVSANPGAVWKVRAAETVNPVYAKLHVVSIESPAQSNAGRVTIEYAVQSAPGAPLGPVQRATLDGSGGGTVYFDFARGAITDASDWDIALKGYDILLNSGVSGSGRAGAVRSTSVTFAAMTDAGDAPAQIYAADAFGGVFRTNPWYRYNLDGNNTIFPTYDVYLIRRGTEIYKVQVTGYYGVDGKSRQVTLRSTRLTE